MTDRELFCRDLLQHGAHITIVRQSGGTVCPCTAKTGQYSPAWHRNHPAEPDCGGLERLNTVTVTIPARAFVFNYTLMKNFCRHEIIGQVNRKDMMLIGTAAQADGGFIDLGDMDEKRDVVIYNNERFKVRQYVALSTDGPVAQFVILRQIGVAE